MAELFSTDKLSHNTDIENKLTEMYSQTASSDDTMSVPFSRALHFNLLICAGCEASKEYVNVATEIVGRQPCRAIVVTGNSDKTDAVDVSVSLVCGLSERGDRHLCGEVVQMEFGSPEQVVGTVVPLLVPEVPVVLWAAGSEMECDAARIMYGISDYIVVDGDKLDPEKAINAIVEICDEISDEACVNDIVWSSLLPWREAVAEHFDLEHARTYLESVSKVEIVSRELSLSAFYIAGWLCDRLGMSVGLVNRDTRKVTINASQSGRNVTLEIVGGRDENESVGVSSVTVECADARGTAVFESVCNDGGDIVIGEVCPGMVCLPKKTIPTGNSERLDVLVFYLSYLQRDTVFEGVVEKVVQMIK